MSTRRAVRRPDKYSSSGPRFFDVRRCLFQQFKDVLVVNGVVDKASRAAWTNHTHAAKEPQLMRHSRLADADKRCDVAHAQLAARERVENANPCGIAKNPKCIGQRFNGSRAHQGKFALFREMRRVTSRRNVD